MTDNLPKNIRKVARGYGGMLFIAILGLSILIFGGIMSNARQIRELQTSIAKFEREYKAQLQLGPLVALIDEQSKSLKKLNLTNPNRPLPVSEISTVTQTIEDFAHTATLRPVSIRHLLQSPTEESMRLRVEIRLQGQGADFQSFMESIFNWNHRSEIEGFTIDAEQKNLEIQLVLGIPLSS